MYGHARLGDFFLDPGVLHLNHGSYGAVPRPVSAAAEGLRREAEARATCFQRERHPQLMAAARRAVADRLGGDAGGWVFVENATAAANAVFASEPVSEGDEILMMPTTYGAVRKAAMHWLAPKGVVIREVDLPLPIAAAEAVVDAFRQALTEKVKLVVIDQIISPLGLVLPVGQVIRLAQEAGARVFVDGAHVSGQVGIDVGGPGADYWCGNLHKWAFAPRGCGVMWVAPQHRNRVRPMVASHGVFDGYAEAFDWIGTRDAAPWHVAPQAFAAHDAFGGSEMMSRNWALAAEAARMLAEAIGAEAAGPEEMWGAMVSVRLPGVVGDPVRAQAELARLGVEAGIFPWEDGLCFRVSASVYNELQDFERVLPILREVFDLPLK